MQEGTLRPNYTPALGNCPVVRASFTTPQIQGLQNQPTVSLLSLFASLSIRKDVANHRLQLCSICSTIVLHSSLPSNRASYCFFTSQLNLRPWRRPSNRQYLTKYRSTHRPDSFSSLHHTSRPRSLDLNSRLSLPLHRGPSLPVAYTHSWDLAPCLSAPSTPFAPHLSSWHNNW